MSPSKILAQMYVNT